MKVNYHTNYFTNKLSFELQKAKKLIAITCACSVIASVSTGCSMLPKEDETLAPPLKEPPKIVYDTITAKKGTIERKIEITATFVSIAQKDISFKENSGRLKKIHVKAGDKVKAGTLLAELESDDLEDNIKQQEIKLKKQQAAYELLKSTGLKDYEAEVNKLSKLKRQFDTMNQMQEAYSKEQIDDIRDQVSIQESKCSSELVKYNLNIKQSEYDIQAISVELDGLKRDYDNTKLVSPIDGTVDYVSSAKEGETIDAYKTIARVVDPANLQLQYSDDKVSDFELGNKVEVTINGSKHNGEVVMTPSNMPVDADEKVKKSIRIKVDDLPKETALGETAMVSLIKERKENVIVLPKNAVHILLSKKYVLVLENELKKERDVDVGIETVTEVEIVKGLEEGEKVIK